jgi:hypothetical protein
MFQKNESASPSAPERKPMKLALVFLFGFFASLGVVGGLVWLFAAYETSSLLPIFHGPRLSQDKWFEVIRNAVTTAAALGVGITLFFSYRRQQTAEHNQRVAAEAQLTSAKAQQTAADALDLSNRQHALDLDRRRDAVTSELRTRYAQTAEQLGSTHLPVRLAGVYSLAALADDWAENGNEDERQVCIDLLSAYFRSEQPGEDAVVKRELVEATLQVVQERLGTATVQRKFWGSSRILLRDPGQLPSLRNITLNRGGRLTISGATVKSPAYWRDIELNGGHLNVTSLGELDSWFAIKSSRVEGGTLSLSVIQNREREKGSRPPRLELRQLMLDGRGKVRIYAPGCQVVFEDCVFRDGSMTITTRSRLKGDSVSFTNCLFETDVFSASPFGPARSVGPTPALSTTALAVSKDCRFEKGATVLLSVTPETNDL